MKIMSMNNEAIRQISPSYDPWDPIQSLKQYGRHVLTSVEMTVTNLCNMRCEHCAVGDSLVMKEPEHIPLDMMLSALDEVEHLQTISITGGEPTFRKQTVDELIVPLLKYARSRGIRSQINSNLTLDYERYEKLLPYLDVMHISFNYTSERDFHEVGFARSGHPVKSEVAYRMYDKMVENTRRLSEEGMFISAESMINYRTYEKLPEIHRLILEMGCKRHEVHPMYAADFAEGLPMLSLDQMRGAIHSLLDARDPNLWMLFGTLPFFACNPSTEDAKLLRRLREEPNVTVRNDPDGRNRVNVNMFTGDVFVTDFAAIPAFGNLRDGRLDDIFEKWLTEHPLNQNVNCHCPAANCCGPNLLVADMYYKDIDFKSRKAIAL
ncbi:radical SAM/CxCxxxxC motif protein YfkAB [Paenibacillus motobuensis]|uniref:radical SAM/CxCxxxxC motif protein YfkAB n=1 Tax=Paenibacillus TaxID=44249 RepID=UPI002041103B|nr:MULTISPECIES: radical SAM/CxCxxxxC motif protein YfkAB [Paenibacillus]MCM3038797.1 radical SAM/CxCxxxxC motif protein YfkAB [Paenibacillus lutimineralis]MCM3645901.1 radical SAM/CxCxxxxC motif protein YfkAB [Paenibacillus motobuensis]